jgi:hypothetical protein
MEKPLGSHVSMPKGTTSKETVETRSYDEQFFFMGKFPELLGSPTYVHFCWIIGSCGNNYEEYYLLGCKL